MSGMPERKPPERSDEMTVDRPRRPTPFKDMSEAERCAFVQCAAERAKKIAGYSDDEARAIAENWIGSLLRAESDDPFGIQQLLEQSDNS